MYGNMGLQKRIISCSNLVAIPFRFQSQMDKLRSPTWVGPGLVSISPHIISMIFGHGNKAQI